MKLFTIYDSAAQTYMRPFVAQSQGAALRELRTLANDRNHPIGQYPADYTLHELASFDELEGKLAAHEGHPVRVINAGALVDAAEEVKRHA